MMDTSHGNELDYTVALYEASLDGSVSTLDSLMQRDRLILHKISLTSFTETPLHIAALLGHLQFTKALLKRKPQLVEKVDSSGRTALHLASAEGHTQVVKALLQANMDMCLVSDQEKRIPLHLAAMRGHVEVIKELLIAHPRSISRVNLYGDNVLHLCVRYNCLDALKLFVEYSVNDEDFVNSKDNDGNTILHLAVMLWQTKTIEYLLSMPELKRKANAKNRIGNMTALDVSETCHRDFKYLKIQDILKAAGVGRSKDLNSPLLPALHDEEAQSAQPIIEEQPALSRFRKWWRYFYLCRCFKHLKSRGNWIDETRGTLMLVATVIATVTFQAGLNPPGGVWQQDSNDGTVRAGTSIFQSHMNSDGIDRYYYELFLYFNATSFVAALSVLLVVISGFPLRNKFFIWFLTLTMIIAIGAMALSYFKALYLVNPRYLEADSVPLIYVAVFLVSGAIHIIRLITWLITCKRPANDAIKV
ncbi:protein ACCELERATED CELL DEATH 6-like [Juglans regia]|uniref:Protein ACCELERATED CELL DEATH 6-like n=1 Tax=Juglans regia TaxID=51240 RepID=A0A6P9E7Q7_JUGRE|nr:protein ACCELERATED CELL DEATH 6-like [Juglans regia]